MPLLRIGTDWFQSIDDCTVAAWLVDAYFAGEAFGFPTNPEWMGVESTFSFCRGRYLDPSASAAARLLEAYYAHITETPGAEVRRHEDRHDAVFAEAYAIAPMPPANAIIGHARFRAFDFPPVSGGDVARHLAMADLAARVDAYRREVCQAFLERERLEVAYGTEWAWFSGAGEQLLASPGELQRVLTHTAHWSREGCWSAMARLTPDRPPWSQGSA